MNFKEIVQKAINAEANVGLRSTIIVQDLDINCLEDHCPSNNIASKMQTQETTTKDFSRLEEPKTKDPKLLLLYDNLAKPAKKEDKQKRFKCQ